jgi:hypothetical protein
MSESPETQTHPLHASPLVSLIDQIELTLTSPADFTSTTSQLLLPQLLQRSFGCEDVDVESRRVARIETWCGELGDATRAAFAREVIIQFLEEVERWGDWEWEAALDDVEERKIRVDEIKRSLRDLPIEWLKSRVQGSLTLSTDGC